VGDLLPSHAARQEIEEEMTSFDRDYKQSQRERLQEELDQQEWNQRSAGLVLLGMAMVAFWAWFWWSLGA
jgi:hypothetical protein